MNSSAASVSASPIPRPIVRNDMWGKMIALALYAILQILSFWDDLLWPHAALHLGLIGCSVISWGAWNCWKDQLSSPSKSALSWAIGISVFASLMILGTCSDISFMRFSAIVHVAHVLFALLAILIGMMTWVRHS